ncbi:MAG: hypothetical protein RL557_377 [archaeon]|jgi:endonuclease IV
MKIGVKCYHEEDFLDYFIGKADFFEVQGLRNKDYSFLKKYRKQNIPIVIHAEHHKQGCNPADKSLKTTAPSIQQAIRIANLAESKKIILHAGIIDNKHCSEEQAINFVNSLKDRRLLIENTFRNRKEGSLCTTPEEMKSFLKKTKKGFIFDLAHCIISAHLNKKDPWEFIQAFLKLKPKHFHLSGQKWDSLQDLHLSLTKCDFDLAKILRLYPKDAEITLEVSKYKDKTDEDVKFIRKIISKL